MNNKNYFINKLLLEKARTILHKENIDNCTEEELTKKEIIIALCLKYNFKYQFINDIVFIYSIIDEWYFSYMKNVIPLFHKNKLYTTKQYHIQRKFKEITHILQYIKKHDNFYYKPNSKHKFNFFDKQKKINKNSYKK